jgi:murein DD-endopeptidase MepM/ murein hydrolase activator NlpD
VFSRGGVDVVGLRWGRLAAGLFLVLMACGGRKTHDIGQPLGTSAPRAPGVYHTVRPGETLARIGRTYGVAYTEIARVNQLRDASRIAVGEQLWIPGAVRVLEVPPDDGLSLAPRDRAPAAACPRDALRLEWPLTAGLVTSGFGVRHGNYHDGIDIAAPAGAAVRAAADGEVAFSGALPGYGNMLIVRHVRGYVTVYAHVERQYAAEGARVRRGQLIASVGQSGRATGPNLHFEVRKDNSAYDPLQFLPAAGSGGGLRALDNDMRGAGAGGG